MENYLFAALGGIIPVALIGLLLAFVVEKVFKIDLEGRGFFVEALPFLGAAFVSMGLFGIGGSFAEGIIIYSLSFAFIAVGTIFFSVVRKLKAK